MLHAEVVAQMGYPDILFNNAGITGPRVRIGPRSNTEDMSLEAFEHTWRAQALLPTQLCGPHAWRVRDLDGLSFVPGTHGIWMPLAWVVAAVLGGVSPHYASSKSALHGLMHWVASGTEMLANPPGDYRKLIPFGVPEDVASCVETLVLNAYMTNEASLQWFNGRPPHGRIWIVVMDGGMTASTF
ncbi:hypothetical protein BDN71DRAFT_1497528 [Pleurotus eryngii]|uniref:Uncharacterized protein n=1 Tax=Pleurotus eryngii TaxID=5323 RepID=A0A9P5ZRI2_PLEER|nr:hypothetical protein BDN71DRAFT_1497528 [Pleurotus eryngii]